MPYLIEVFKGEEAKRLSKEMPPTGPGFSQDELKNVFRLEIWGSLFSDPGADYVEWRLFDIKGNRVNDRRVEGY